MTPFFIKVQISVQKFCTKLLNIPNLFFKSGFSAEMENPKHSLAEAIEERLRDFTDLFKFLGRNILVQFYIFCFKLLVLILNHFKTIKWLEILKIFYFHVFLDCEIKLKKKVLQFSKKFKLTLYWLKILRNFQMLNSKNTVLLNLENSP